MDPILDCFLRTLRDNFYLRSSVQTLVVPLLVAVNPLISMSIDAIISWLTQFIVSGIHLNHRMFQCHLLRYREWVWQLDLHVSTV